MFGSQNNSLYYIIRIGFELFENLSFVLPSLSRRFNLPVSFFRTTDYMRELKHKERITTVHNLKELFLALP